MRNALAFFVILCFILSSSIASAVVGGGDLTYKPKGAKPVIFSHEQHVNVKTLKCSACHYHAFQMTKDSYEMDMAKITKGKFCGVCHNGKRSFGVNDKAHCNKCHQ